MGHKWKTVWVLITILTLLIPTAGAVSAVGTILYVAPGGLRSGSCVSWATACDLQYALGRAAPGSALWVREGTYYPTDSANRTVSFVLRNGVALYGGFAGNETVLSQRDPAANITTLSGNVGDRNTASDNSFHVVVTGGVDSTTVLDGFTIQDGEGAGGSPPDSMGGGMYNYNGSRPTLSNLIFQNNHAGHSGGGMFNNISHPTLTNVTFRDNWAPDGGGGMYNLYQSSPVLTNVTFISNAAGAGGGMYNDRSYPVLTDVTFDANWASSCSHTFCYGTGGGMSNSGSVVTLTNVTFRDNLIPDLGGGGGMYNSDSQGVLTNVTFSGNSARLGSGLYFEGNTTMSLIHVTFSGNTAYESAGGALYNTSNMMYIRNSILYGNTGGQIVSSPGQSPSIVNSDVQGGCPAEAACINVIDADPLLGPLQDNGGFTETMALGAGSPAIDAAEDESCPDRDQRGVARPQGTACDMGAYESTLPTISGNVGVGGAMLSYTGGTSMADSMGNYSFSVPLGWSGSVTPSKAGYTFLPASRVYTNVISHQTAQNYTAIALSISGNTGAAGVTLSYMDQTLKTVTSQTNGSYSLPVPSGWSGSVTPSHACFTFDPASRNYTNVITDQTSQNYTATVIPGSGCADVNVSVAGVDQGRFGVPPQGSTRASFGSLNNGPVKIKSTNASTILGAERVIYKVNNTNTSFTEMMGLPDSLLDTTYWLPWYNNKDLDTQLRIANVSGSTASIQVFIGGQEMTGSPFTLAAGASTRKTFTGVNDGPVEIVSTHGVPIVAAERLIYKVNGVAASFSEMMALPNSQLDTTYWLPWYNNKDFDTQLRIANVSDAPATIHIYISGDEMAGSPFTLGAGASARKSYAGINDGPVKIESNVNIVAAERVIYKVNGVGTSFSEMMALPNSQLDTTYWLPWYNNKDLNTQLRFANTSNSTATVHVYIGGAEMIGSPLTLLVGDTARWSFPGINGGPVRIVSDHGVPIIAAERVIYKVNNIATSFSEMMGLPDSQLDSTYWLPWYNNVDLDTQLRFGVP